MSSATLVLKATYTPRVGTAGGQASTNAGRMQRRGLTHVASAYTEAEQHTEGLLRNFLTAWRNP